MADVDEEVKRGDVLTKHLYGLLCGILYSSCSFYSQLCFDIICMRVYRVVRV